MLLKIKPLLVYVNNTPVYMPGSSTVMQACEKLGFVIPRFCYHDLLEIAGNCRICLVEIEGSPKPIASCGLPLIDQIRIYTDSPLVKKAREGVIEFLLLNHPLDCPICDQGGECDLQNQVLAYGNTISRFYKYKRGVEDKGLGPIIKTIITRCIHCTRCIRFAADIAGVEDLGTTLRGNQTEVGTYVEKTFNSELSGNIIDLCPVGALTSRVYAFKARPWEVKSTKSIDTSDSLGSNITIETKKSKILRVIPAPNTEINLEWLSDKARFAYEGNSQIRLAFPYFKHKNKYKRLISLKNLTIFKNFFVNSYNLRFMIGRNLDNETLLDSKHYARRFGADIDSEIENNLSNAYPEFFISTLKLNDLEKTDFCLLLGVNPRSEASLANVWLRARFKQGCFNVSVLGMPYDLTYKSNNLGLNPHHLLKLVKGQSKMSLNSSKNPTIIYGDSLSRREDGITIFRLSSNFIKLYKTTSKYAIYRLPLGSNSIGKSFLGLAKPILKAFRDASDLKAYILGNEENFSLKKHNKISIIETKHTNKNFKNCEFLLPLQSVLEKTGNFINFSGVIQENKNILRFGEKPLNLFSNLVKTLKKVTCPKTPSFSDYLNYRLVFDSKASSEFIDLKMFSKLKFQKSPFKSIVGDMYKTDASSYTSKTLIKVSANLRKAFWHFS